MLGLIVWFLLVAILVVGLVVGGLSLGWKASRAGRRRTGR